MAACTSEPAPEGEGGAGAGGAAAGAPGTGGSGLGGESTGGSSTGGGAATGGATNTPTVCYPAPESLEYWWDQENPDLNYQINEAVHGVHAQIVAPAGYGVTNAYVGKGLGYQAQVMTFANSPVLSDLPPWPLATVEFWLNSQHGDCPVLLNNKWSFKLVGGNGVAAFVKADTDGDGPDVAKTVSVTTSTSLQTPVIDPSVKKFHHVAIQNDVENMEMRIYVDGELDASVDVTAALGLPEAEAKAIFTGVLETSGTSALEMGGKGASAGQGLWGYIDELSLYGDVLPENDIVGIYKAKTKGKCRAK